MKRAFKNTLYSLLILDIIALVYSCTPRVWHKKSPYGTVLSTANILPQLTLIS
jgi:hypothetical protein